jgi:hypothetical protein
MRRNILASNAYFICMYRGGQNNGNTKKVRNRILFILATLKELQLATLNDLPFVFTLCSGQFVSVLSDSLCKRIGNWETCSILKEDIVGARLAGAFVTETATLLGVSRVTVF